MKIPFSLKKKKVFIALGYCVYSRSMLQAVQVADKLQARHNRRGAESCDVAGRVEFMCETFYWVRFSFLKAMHVYAEPETDGTIQVPGRPADLKNDRQIVPLYPDPDQAHEDAIDNLGNRFLL